MTYGSSQQLEEVFRTIMPKEPPRCPEVSIKRATCPMSDTASRSQWFRMSGMWHEFVNFADSLIT